MMNLRAIAGVFEVFVALHLHKLPYRHHKHQYTKICCDLVNAAPVYTNSLLATHAFFSRNVHLVDDPPAALDVWNLLRVARGQERRARTHKKQSCCINPPSPTLAFCRRPASPIPNSCLHRAAAGASITSSVATTTCFCSRSRPLLIICCLSSAISSIVAPHWLLHPCGDSQSKVA